MKTVISVKVDKDVKEKAQEVAASAGISMSSLVNAYLKQIGVTRRIELYAPEQMTPKLEKLVKEVELEIANGKTSAGFTTADAFLADLKK
jgi:DNA-damage-inducible protein J